MPALAQALIDTVDQSHLQALGFDVLGVGDSDTPPGSELPAKLLVQVRAGVEWDQGMRLAVNCHSRLLEFGLDPDSIHCEIFEANPPCASSHVESTALVATPVNDVMPLRPMSAGSQYAAPRLVAYSRRLEEW